MTTTTAPRAGAALSGVAVTWPRVLRSEWVRLRSLRSTWITLAVTVALVVGLAALACWARASHWPPRDPAELVEFNPTTQSIAPGTFFGQLAAGVLGVLLVTGEYSTGMIRATFTAVPRRAHVLVARAAVFATLMVVTLVPAVLLAFTVGQALLSTKGIDTSLDAPGVARCVVGAGLYLVAIGLLGMALGWLLRHTAGAIATLFGLLLVVPIVLHFLPDPWPDRIMTWMPGGVNGTAGVAVFTPHPGLHSLAPWAGFGMLMAYVVGLLLLGVATLRARDV